MACHAAHETRTKRPKLVQAKQNRNSQILELHKQGVSRSDIAAKHRVTNGRIAQIVAATSSVDARLAELQETYGKRPDIARLSDDTPLDVLILAKSDTHGWAVRILALTSGRRPIKTLGELRNLSDMELLSRRGVGTGLFAEIRALCPYAQPQNADAAPKKARRKPEARPQATVSRSS